MKAPAPRFDPDDLRDLAGDTTFERGLAYFRQGLVRITRLDAGTVAATVSGSEDYRVRLRGSGARTSGSCTCPAYDDTGFCKHMVATALAASSAEGEGAGDPMAALRAHLEALPVTALVALLLEAAGEDPALHRRLELAAAARNPREAAPAFRRALTEITRRSRLPEYREVRGWAAEVEAILDAIHPLAEGPSAAAALELADHALSRIEAALGQIDDSDGHVGGLLARAADIHLAACEALRPEPLALARDLFARETADVFDTFYAAADRYAGLLGPAGRAEYHRLARAEWDKLPARGPRHKPTLDDASPYTLFHILDRLAEEDGDLSTRIALRAKNLAAPHDYARLAEFCRANGRPAEAEAHLWRAFAAGPSEALYQRLAGVGGEAARERALAALEERLARAKPDHWSRPADFLLRLLVEERRYDRAWAIAAAHPAGDCVLEALATATEASHPQEAVAAHAQRVHRLASAGGAPAYAEAAAIVARLAKLQPPAEHAAFLADLRTRFARRRTFVKLLG